MKLKLFPIFIFSAAIAMTSCGGSDSEGSDSDDSSDNKAPYYIELGDDLSECNGPKEVNYMSDGVADITTFEIGSGKIEFTGFHDDFDSEPSNVEGKTYDAKIIFSNTVEGSATITKVGEGVERSIGFDHKIEGTFEGNDGSKGSFSVSGMFFP